MAEASRLAFADRNVYIGDPDFVPVPASGLLDPDYLTLRAGEIEPTKALGKRQPGMPGPSADNARPGGTDGEKGLSTTHLSIIDADGNAVSLTASIERAFGSYLMVRDLMAVAELVKTGVAFEAYRAALAQLPAAATAGRASLFIAENKNKI